MSSEPDIHARHGGRIAMADDSPMTDRQREVYEKIVSGKRGRVVGPLRAVLHSPELAERWQALGEYLRYNTSLPVQLSELAIVMTGRFWNCQVEYVIHARIAAEAGLDQDVIESIRRAQSPVFADAQQHAVYEYTRELLAHGQATDARYTDLLGEIGAGALVELTGLVGYYTMVAMTLNAHDVPLPDNETATRLDLSTRGRLLEPTNLPASTLA